MPLQNRVTPDGAIVATPARGEMYGNRGSCFHRDDKTLKPRHWGNRQWICCVLQFKNRRRRMMQPGLFTELFFLDEATAFAAGHRPCFECRRTDAVEFRRLWARALSPGTLPSAPEMDVRLHAERLREDGTKRIALLPAADLPDGAMIRLDGRAWLVRGAQLHAWSVEGYSEARHRPRGLTVDCLTPPATVAILTAGYHPMLHSSLDSR